MSIHHGVSFYSSKNTSFLSLIGFFRHGTRMDYSLSPELGTMSVFLFVFSARLFIVFENTLSYIIFDCEAFLRL